MPACCLAQRWLGSSPLAAVTHERWLFPGACAQLITDIKCSKNVNNFTKSLATKVGVAKNVFARSCDLGGRIRDGLIMPGQKLVCRSHVFFDNSDVSQK